MRNKVPRPLEITHPPSERLNRILRITMREDDGIIEPRNLFSSVQVFYDGDIARQVLRRKLKSLHGKEGGKRGKSRLYQREQSLYTYNVYAVYPIH